MATPIPSNRTAFSAWEVAAATGGTLLHAAGPAVGFTTDSRAVTPGAGFVAIMGEHHDGHAFVADALARGAALVVLRSGAALPRGTGASVVLVEDTLRAWGDLARAHLQLWRRGRRDTKTVGITGSSGKTTTKELCAALLGRRGVCHATSGNLNNRVGVPAVAFGVEPGTRFAVFELGMSEPGEMAELTRIVEPDVGVLLNVGVAHAGGVGGTRAGVAREKGALVEALSRDALAVINADDDAAWAQRVRSGASVVSFGQGVGCDYRLVDRDVTGSAGARVTLARAGERFSVTMPLLGEAAAVDLVAALAAADGALGDWLTPAEIEEGLRSVRTVGGRARLVELDGVLALDDTYNANPASMRAALATLSEVAPAARRKVCVLGEMRELGPLAEAEHDALGDEIARGGVAVVIGCGGLVDRSLRRAKGHGVTVFHGEDTEAAAAIAVREVKPGDVVLLKGSRGVAVERVLAALAARFPPPEIRP